MAVICIAVILFNLLLLINIHFKNYLNKPTAPRMMRLPHIIMFIYMYNYLKDYDIV